MKILSAQAIRTGKLPQLEHFVALQDIIRNAAKPPYISDAVIYGSVIYGTPNRLSDIDVIFAVERGGIRRARRIRQGLLVQAKKLNIPLDIHLLTTDNRELEKPETASPSYLEMIDYAAENGGQIKGSVTGYFALKRNEPWADAHGYALNRLEDLELQAPAIFDPSKRPYHILDRIVNQPTHATRKLLQAMGKHPSGLKTSNEIFEQTAGWLPHLFSGLGELQACRDLYANQALALDEARGNIQKLEAQTIEYNAYLEHLYRVYLPKLRQYLAAVVSYADQYRPSS